MKITKEGWIYDNFKKGRNIELIFFINDKIISFYEYPNSDSVLVNYLKWQ
jgi:hypothetical protein